MDTQSWEVEPADYVQAWLQSARAEHQYRLEESIAAKKAEDREREALRAARAAERDASEGGRGIRKIDCSDHQARASVRVGRVSYQARLELMQIIPCGLKPSRPSLCNRCCAQAVVNLRAARSI